MMTGKTKRYEKIKHLGEGQYANVYKAKDTQTNQIVAIKKIKFGSRQEAKDGVNRTALREIKLLQELKHDNIIGLLDVIGQKNNVSLVFDFMETDLEQIIKDEAVLLHSGHVKNLMIQTLSGLEFMHAHWILHRDLKPNNLLLNEHGVLKLGDFGLARFFGSPNRVYTHQVVTRWYRAPELLLGARNYGVGVDIWAVGCIFAELLLRVPIFPGESDLDQLTKIADIIGSATEEDWPNMVHLPDFVRLKPCPAIPLQQIFTAAGTDTLQLMTSLLMYDPRRRCDCTQALHYPYFTNLPHPSPNEDLPLPGKQVKHGTKRRRNNVDNFSPVSKKRLAFN